jgi:hypothetical protein
MAPEIPLDRQRPAAVVHDKLVHEAITELPERPPRRSERSHAA